MVAQWTSKLDHMFRKQGHGFETYPVNIGCAFIMVKIVDRVVNCQVEQNRSKAYHS